MQNQPAHLRHLLRCRSKPLRESQRKMARVFVFSALLFAATLPVVVLAAAAAAASEPPCRPAIFAFGDWLANAGRAAVDAGRQPEGCFYGDSGRVFVDYIAEFADLASIPHFSKPLSDLSNGASFAFRGAGALPETNQGLTMDLQTQIKEFEKVQSVLVKEHGDAKAKEIVSNAVYFVSAGANDYMGYFNNPKIHESYVVENFQGMVIGNLSQAIQDLYNKGARKFCLISLGPLGCMPYFRAMNPDGEDAGCVEDVSKLAVEHNRASSGIAAALHYLLEGFSSVSFNLYDWMNERSRYPSKYGFKDGENACCVHSGRDGDEQKLCENPEEYIWWDSIRVSEAIHKQLATELWAAEPTQASPILKELLLSCGPTSTTAAAATTTTTIGDAIDDREELMGFGGSTVLAS